MSGETTGYTHVEMGSERNFGLVLAGVFVIIGLWPLIGSAGVRLWALAIAGGFFVFAVVHAKGLRRLNILWFKFGLLLGRIVTPLVMALLYITTVVPTGLVMRALGKDGLRLKHQDLATYWISRPEPGPKKGTMKDQF